MKVIYCIGDIHGRVDLLRVAKNLIKFDAKKRGYTEKKIVYLGDYIDRGPDSYGVIESLMNEPLKGFEEIFLKGNHEDIMLHSLYGASVHQRDQYRRMWLANGGVTCLLSYGNKPNTTRKDFYSDPYIWDWGDVKQSIPDDHIEFMTQLGINHIDGNLFFVHAGVDPRAGDITNQADNVYMWIRDACYIHTGEFKDSKGNAFRIIHGHTPTRDHQVYVSKNRVNLDTGSVYDGIVYVGVFAEDGDRIITSPPMGNLRAIST